MYESRKIISGPQSDFVASSLRSQLAALGNILNNIESSQRIEDAYLEESLKQIEKELHRVRKFFSSN